MKKKIITTALLAAFGGMANVALAADGKGFRVGGLEVTPGIKVSESHNDNIFSQEKVKNSSWITTIQPGVSISSDTGSRQMEAHYQLSKGINHSSRNDDSLDHFVGASSELQLTYRLSAGLSVDYSKTHDPRGSTFTGTGINFPTPDKYHETTVGGKLSFGVKGRLDLTGSYSNKRYDNHHSITRTRDLDSAGVGLAFSYPVGPKTRAVLEARYKQFNYKFFSATTNLDSSEQLYYAGADWKATAKTTGKLRLGYLKKNFSKAGLVNDSQLSWELGVLWEPMSYSSWELDTSSKPTESDGTGSYTKSNAVNLIWNHQWSSYLQHTVSLGYTENKFFGTATARKDKITTVGVGMDYQIQPWLSVDSRYDFTNRNSNAANSSYRDNIWALSLTGTL